MGNDQEQTLNYSLFILNSSFFIITYYFLLFAYFSCIPILMALNSLSAALS